jgi:beta-aspartyl-peptidase (threonine type)
MIKGIIEKIGLILLLFFIVSCTREKPPRYVIVVHGGAGAISADLPDSAKQEYISGLNEALSAGEKILQKGGKSIDAVEAAIRVMEDNPLFNAGKGSVYTYEGRVSMDASIMDGQGSKAGAVAGVEDVRHPISLARMVMDSSEYVFLSGRGASEFARKYQLETADSAYFFTPGRWEEHQRKLKESKLGTVGCVALDQEGNLAAGTSTGGLTNKRWGRIGDTPVIGAGTYASNKSCAVSCTGIGEYFIRFVVAHSIADMVEYKGWTIRQAANFVINELLKRAGGEGGVIALDRNGNIAMVYNTKGMFRGYAKSNGERWTGIFAEKTRRSAKP